MTEQEVRLQILRTVIECGSELQKSNPLPICEEYYKWIKGKTIRNSNLTDSRKQTAV
jgi:hypothetical protein